MIVTVWHESAQMVFIDRLAPGRVAHGEAYAFRKLASLLQIRIVARSSLPLQKVTVQLRRERLSFFPLFVTDFRKL
ncbi:MAG: urease accessory protein UreH [Verrucomicrobiales bacterium]